MVDDLLHLRDIREIEIKRIIDAKNINLRSWIMVPDEIKDFSQLLLVGLGRLLKRVLRQIRELCPNHFHDIIATDRDRNHISLLNRCLNLLVLDHAFVNLGRGIAGDAEI